MTNVKKLYIGAKLKDIRQNTGMTQAKFASSLGISTSYLNLMENNQRHVTAAVLLTLASKFQVDIASLSDNDIDRIIFDLNEAFSDSQFENNRPTKQELNRVALLSPDFARAFLNIHQSYLITQKQLAELDDAFLRGSINLTPYEEVRDFFHYQDNYIHDLDIAGEDLAQKLDSHDGTPSERLINYLNDTHNITVIFDKSDSTRENVRIFDAKAKTLKLNARMSQGSQIFQMAHQIGLLEQSRKIEEIANGAAFSTDSAKDICKMGLANYFAGSVILPYTKFIEAAQSLRHDLEILSDYFYASIEQVMHRLSTLQKPNKKGLPFFFARVDQAGNITKRHSATKLQFARFGSACPLWNVHSAFETPTKIIKQLAETADGEKYISIATAKFNRVGGYKSAVTRYALALGCEIEYADSIVYCDDLNTDSSTAFDKIGVSCRICTRSNCLQRSLPPLNKDLSINLSQRKIVPFQFD